MKIRTIQPGAMTWDLNEDEMKKALEAELRKIALNTKAVNLLHNAIYKEEYARIKSCKTAKEIWDMLETAHVGNNQVNHTRIRLLAKEYQKFE
ncbi:hypothetical protein LIER_00889 [Lithospermum erythrorhizon]|uniref:UBN2 domain-containing protein n=1 Tax=Lithospermum erythrorhizon TaxID=34254 RepID=A0AAV3NK79_LITER